MKTVELAKELISRKSVTPDDAGCQKFIAQTLEKIGFTCEHLKFEDVENLWATHGSGPPLFCFLGHTDVVPAGEEDDWKFPPFCPTQENGFLYGRGAADMKGCLASFISASCEFVSSNPAHKGTLALLLTSDEEGLGINGTAAVLKEFQGRGTKIDLCLVGEPSSEEKLGDVVKVGRRGSLSGKLRVSGIQGHVAYQHLARNPIHQVLPALSELSKKTWDHGNEFFPATSFQISNMNAGTGADNVIPGKIDVLFNFRYSTETDADQLKAQVQEIFDKHQLQYQIDWRLSGRPFLTRSGQLVDAVVKAIVATTGEKPRLSTAGGTSDGRFVAPTGAQVVEFGLVNRSIHKVNEHTLIDDLDGLREIYKAILDELLLQEIPL